jgi:hypothetical protein
MQMDYANIILEMMDRIQKLEKQVEELKQSLKPNPDLTENVTTSEIPLQANVYQPSLTRKRDTTRYLFEGNIYLKNRLVLAVVTSYVKKNPTVTRQRLKQVFDRSLQGSIGVVEDKEIATMRMDYDVRFFAREDEVLHLDDGDMFVCTQWGIGNIPSFIRRATQLGFLIEAIY